MRATFLKSENYFRFHFLQKDGCASVFQFSKNISKRGYKGEHVGTQGHRHKGTAKKTLLATAFQRGELANHKTFE